MIHIKDFLKGVVDETRMMWVSQLQWATQAKALSVLERDNKTLHKQVEMLWNLTRDQSEFIERLRNEIKEKNNVENS